MKRVDVAAITNRGLVRGGNEDRVAVFGWLAPQEMHEPVVLVRRTAEPLLMVVADGLGGHQAGEVASEFAVTALSTALRELAEDAAGVFARVHQDLLELGEARTELSGMATTATALLVADDLIMICHVGDSRAYYVEPGLVSQLTADDVDPVAGGALTQVLGGLPGRDVVAQVRTVDQADSLRFLLCTDGLHSYVDPAVIRRRVALGTVFEAATGLHEAAVESGAPDNVSLCVVDVWLEGEGHD
ncbi:PP2C family protein-serine/threonine phosphatase [Lentzea sp. NPDC102401]|uniref:PP2C family protein-serine/threonine phosphatase n=1 Tax=Lentzea sp. NPDC102401 TaxID=3364128 RepID=UPI003827FF56